MTYADTQTRVCVILRPFPPPPPPAIRKQQSGDGAGQAIFCRNANSGRPRIWRGSCMWRQQVSMRSSRDVPGAPSAPRGACTPVGMAQTSTQGRSPMLYMQSWLSTSTDGPLTRNHRCGLRNPMVAVRTQWTLGYRV